MAKATRNEYHPDVVSPPGDTLLETLENIGMTQMELAERTGRPLKTINEIIKGKAAITPETALQLERVLGIPARFWNNRERHYREYVAHQEEEERLIQQTDWMREVPVAAMVKLKWIEKRSLPVEQARELLNFYGAATPETWKELCYGAQVAYRKSKAFESNPAAVAAWLRKGEMEAREIACEPYNERRFRETLPQLRALSVQDPNTYINEIVRQCAACGVAVVFVREIPGTRLSGAARWLTPDKAVIQISVRYRDDGNLWFTLFHEAAHILLHGKKEFFVDIKVGEGADEKEAEADAFARNLLIPPAPLRRFLDAKDFTDTAILRFARDIEVAPGIVVGRLQHDKVIDYSWGNSLKTRFQWADNDATEESKD